MDSQEVDSSADRLEKSSSILGKKLKVVQAAENMKGRIERSKLVRTLVAEHGESDNTLRRERILGNGKFRSERTIKKDKIASIEKKIDEIRSLVFENGQKETVEDIGAEEAKGKFVFSREDLEIAVDQDRQARKEASEASKLFIGYDGQEFDVIFNADFDGMFSFRVEFIDPEDHVKSGTVYGILDSPFSEMTEEEFAIVDFLFEYLKEAMLKK